jgi:hypothetical protein
MRSVIAATQLFPKSLVKQVIPLFERHRLASPDWDTRFAARLSVGGRSQGAASMNRQGAFDWFDASCFSSACNNSYSTWDMRFDLLLAAILKPGFGPRKQGGRGAEIAEPGA